MDLWLHFGVVGNIVDVAVFVMFIISIAIVQISVLHLLDHIPPSVLSSLVAAADVTLMGLGRVLPSLCGEALLVTDRDALRATLVGSGHSKSHHGQAKGPPQV